MRTRTRNTVQDDTAVSLFTTRQTIDSSSGAPITGPSALHGVLANPTVTSNRGYNLHYSYYGRIGVDESMTDEPSGLGAYNEVTHTKGMELPKSHNDL